MKTLKEQGKTLIPSSFSSVEYLGPYFEAPEDYDTAYGLKKLGSLALVDEDYDINEACIRACIRSNAYKWEKLFKTLSLEYNPIWNVDGTETETHIIGSVHTKKDYGDSTSSATAMQVPDDMTSEKEVSKSSTVRDSYTDQETVDTHTDTIERTRGGNIGVTKTQDMISDERNIANFNYMDIVMKDVINSIAYPYFSEED